MPKPDSAPATRMADDDAARDRLSRGVEILRRVRGEHVAEIVDADIAAGTFSIVTRYVPGKSLEEIVTRDGPLELPGVRSPGPHAFRREGAGGLGGQMGTGIRGRLFTYLF